MGGGSWCSRVSVYEPHHWCFVYLYVSPCFCVCLCVCVNVCACVRSRVYVSVRLFVSLSLCLRISPYTKCPDAVCVSLAILPYRKLQHHCSPDPVCGMETIPATHVGLLSGSQATDHGDRFLTV